MPDPILFQSANRFLAASPSGDFGLYGAQPTIQISIAAPANDATQDSQGTTSTSTALPASGVQPSSDPLPLPGSEDAADTPSATAAPAPIAAAVQPPAATPDAAPELSTSSLNPFDLRPITLSNLGDESAPGSAGPVGGGVAETAGAAPATALSAPVLDAADPIVGGTVQSAAALIQPVVALAPVVLGDTIDSVVGLAQAATNAVLSALDGTIDTVGALTEPLTDTAAGLIGTAGVAADSVTALAGTALDGVAQTTDTVVQPLVATVGEVGQTVLAGADDLPVTDLLGSDPAGGIATLVELVNVADLLDVRDAGAAPADDGVDPDPVSGLLDTLTTDLSDLGHSGDHGAGQDDTSILPTHDALGGLLGGNHDPGLGLGG